MSAGLFSSAAGAGGAGAAGAAAPTFGQAVSSGLGQSLGTVGANSAAGQGVAQAVGSAGGLDAVGSSLGHVIGGAAGGTGPGMFDSSGRATSGVGAGNDLAAMMMSQRAHPAGNQITAAQSPTNSKGGWLGTGLFGNDQWNPNPSTQQPALGTGVANAAMSGAKATAASQPDWITALLNGGQIG